MRQTQDHPPISHGKDGQCVGSTCVSSMGTDGQQARIPLVGWVCPAGETHLACGWKAHMTASWWWSVVPVGPQWGFGVLASLQQIPASRLAAGWSFTHSHPWQSPSLSCKAAAAGQWASAASCCPSTYRSVTSSPSVVFGVVFYYHFPAFRGKF